MAPATFFGTPGPLKTGLPPVAPVAAEIKFNFYAILHGIDSSNALHEIRRILYLFGYKIGFPLYRMTTNN